MAKLTLDIAKEIARSRGGECISQSYRSLDMSKQVSCSTKPAVEFKGVL